MFCLYAHTFTVLCHPDCLCLYKSHVSHLHLCVRVRVRARVCVEVSVENIEFRNDWTRCRLQLVQSASFVVPAVRICCSEREWHTLLLRTQTVSIILKSDIQKSKLSYLV